MPAREYEISWLATVWLPEAVQSLFSVKWQVQVALFICSIQRGALSFMFFFLLAVAERTYKQVSEVINNLSSLWQRILRKEEVGKKVIRVEKSLN